MSKFRKKPVVVEAFQMTEEMRYQIQFWPGWLMAGWLKKNGSCGCVRDMGNKLLSIDTMEGVMSVDWDDWIIKGVKGELYPCKPDIFEATYEAVGSDVPQNADTPNAGQKG